MKKILLCLIFTLMFSACVSVPEQAVTSQELILSGIKKAHANQIMLINAYADENINNVKKLMSTVVLDNVIKKQLKKRKSLPVIEIKYLILEYSKDLNKRLLKIETKRAELLKVANEGYSELINLSKSNLDFTKSLRRTTENQQRLLGEYKGKLQNMEEAIKRYTIQERSE